MKKLLAVLALASLTSTGCVVHHHGGHGYHQGTWCERHPVKCHRHRHHPRARAAVVVRVP